MAAMLESTCQAKARAYVDSILNYPETAVRVSGQSNLILVPGAEIGEGAEDRVVEVRLVVRKLHETLPAALVIEEERKEYDEKKEKAAAALKEKGEKIVRDTKKRKDAARKQTAADLAAMIAGKK